MKKIFGVVLVLFVAFLMGGCGKSYPNGKVSVYNWGEYIDKEVIDMFEEEYGIQVLYSEFTENEDMYPDIEKGSGLYDVVCPSDYMINKMASKGLLAELNYDNIPNISYIDEEYLKKASEFDPGNKYSVPYCWGTLGILYNKSMVDEEITSWSSIFDPKYKNEILMMNSVRDAMGIALVYLGEDMNTADEAALNRARDLLREQHDIVQGYVVDQARDKMIGNEAKLAVIYSGEAIYTKRENSDLCYVVPSEGSNVWMDCWVIPADAKNKENAEKWINFMCRPDIALMNFEEITYSTPNKGAREMIEDEDIKNSTVAFPGDDILSRCHTYTYTSDELDALYVEKWNEVK